MLASRKVQYVEEILDICGYNWLRDSNCGIKQIVESYFHSCLYDCDSNVINA